MGMPQKDGSQGDEASNGVCVHNSGSPLISVAIIYVLRHIERYVDLRFQVVMFQPTVEDTKYQNSTYPLACMYDVFLVRDLGQRHPRTEDSPVPGFLLKYDHYLTRFEL